MLVGTKYTFMRLFFRLPKTKKKKNTIIYLHVEYSIMIIDFK